MNLLQNWKSHQYKPTCEFERNENNFIIRASGSAPRGSWYCFLSENVSAGDVLKFSGTVSDGAIKALFYQGGESNPSGQIDLEDEQAIVIPQGITRLRVDLRNWGGSPEAVFNGIELFEHVPTDPEPPEPPEPEIPDWPALPIPIPGPLPERIPVTGYEWDGKWFLQTFKENGDVTNIGTMSEPWVFEGWLENGRDLRGTLTWPFYADIEPDPDDGSPENADN